MYFLFYWKILLEKQDFRLSDICNVGGVTRTMHVAALAAEYGMRCVPHSANHSRVTVFTLHVWNSIANHGPLMEFSIEGQEQFRSMFSPALVPKDGNVAIPCEGFGWGVTIKDSWLNEAEYLISEK